MLKVKKETASMLTRDGVRLDADIYRPENNNKYPVLLMRQPYGRAIASTIVYAHPRWYAANGYIVVIQDVRGRGTSQGKFELFSNEIEDGYDTINWASQLSGSNGEVGMYGFSYQGMTQLYAAANHPKALKTICPGTIAYDLYTDWAYEGGGFCLQGNLGWALQLATETARLQGDVKAYQILYQASRNLQLYEDSQLFQETFQKYTPSNFYYEWLGHPYPDKYWEQLSPKNFIYDLDLPMLHIGGWFDPYLRGTLNYYKHIVSFSQFYQYLIVGPWGHFPWGRKLGDLDYGDEALNPIDNLQLNWFNKFLKGIDSSIFNEFSVCLFEMGSNIWRHFQNFPNKKFKKYYFSSNGLANIRNDGGLLIPENIEKKSNLINIQNTEDIIVHDPWRAVPALGGHSGNPAGAFDRSQLDCRSDIVTYTSSPLPEDLHIVGDLKLYIYCTSDQETFDLCPILSEVLPNGKVYNFTQGFKRIESDNLSLPIEIELLATCIRIAKGNALRLSISAACFPAYSINPGKKKITNKIGLMDFEIITLKINSGRDNPSHLVLSLN